MSILRHAVEPYMRIFKFLWEFINGRYWRAGKKVHGGSNQASGAGTGTGSVPTPQQPYGTALVGAVGGAFTTAAGAGLSVPTMRPPSPVFFEDDGIKAGEITAYRCWRLARDGLLTSVYQSSFVWNPGEVAKGDADAGDGIHAFKDLVGVAAYGDGRMAVLVTGQIEMWGTVYEHKRGYRSSHAQISAIFDSPFYDAPALRKLYGLK